MLDWGVPWQSPCRCEGLPTNQSSLIRLDDLRLMPASTETNPDAVYQCETCGQHWHASGGWWRPVSERRAKGIHRRNVKARRSRAE